MFCAYPGPRYQVSVNRTIGPLVQQSFYENKSKPFREHVYSKIAFREIYRLITENFEYSNSHSNVLFNCFTSETQHFTYNVSLVSDLNNYVDQSHETLLITSSFRQYIACRNVLTISNQTSRYINKCDRI